MKFVAALDVLTSAHKPCWNGRAGAGFSAVLRLSKKGIIPCPSLAKIYLILLGHCDSSSPPSTEHVPEEEGWLLGTRTGWGVSV